MAESNTTATALPKLLDPLELAGVLSVSRATVFAMIRTGKLPEPVRLGKRLPRWSTEAIRQWIAAGCPRPEGRR